MQHQLMIWSASCRQDSGGRAQPCVTAGCQNGGRGRGQKRKEPTLAQVAKQLRADRRCSEEICQCAVCCQCVSFFSESNAVSPQDARWAKNLLRQTGNAPTPAPPSDVSDMPSACQTCQNSRPNLVLRVCQLCHRWICSRCRRNDIDRCVLCSQPVSGQSGAGAGAKRLTGAPGARRTSARAARLMALAESGELDRMADDATRRAGAPRPRPAMYS